MSSLKTKPKTPSLICTVRLVSNVLCSLVWSQIVLSQPPRCWDYSFTPSNVTRRLFEKSIISEVLASYSSPARTAHTHRYTPHHTPTVRTHSRIEPQRHSNHDRTMELHPTLFCKFGSGHGSELISFGKNVLLLYLNMCSRDSLGRQWWPTDKSMKSANHNEMFLLSLKKGKDVRREKRIVQTEIEKSGKVMICFYFEQLLLADFVGLSPCFPLYLIESLWYLMFSRQKPWWKGVKWLSKGTEQKK